MTQVIFSTKWDIEKFQLKSHYLELWSLISTVPNTWKVCIDEHGNILERAALKQLTEVLKSKKTTTVAYQFLLQKGAESPQKFQSTILNAV